MSSLPRFAVFFVVALTLGIAHPSPAIPIQVGAEARLSLPSSAKHRLFIGNAPDNGTTQTLNPPIFKWIYFENPWTMGWPNATVRSFKFQLTTNASADFSSPVWDITTSNNFYNTLAPITNSNGSTFTGSNFWRIIYMNTNATVNVATSAVHHFSISATATNWDRSQYASSNYLHSVGTNHPHMFFTASNRDAMSAFLKTNQAMGWHWVSRSNAAFATITNSWWNSDSFTNQEPSNFIDAIANVALFWQLTTNATLTAANPGQMVSRAASRFIQLNYDRIDHNINGGAGKFLPLAYDWAYADMTTEQRTNVLWTLEKYAEYSVFSQWWFAGTSSTTNRQYTNTLQIQSHSAAKTGASHERVDAAVGLNMCWAGMGESVLLRDTLLPYFLNYSIAQVDPFNGDEGRGYAEQSFRVLHNVSSQLLLATHDSRMTNNPWYNKYPKMFAYWQPLNYAENQSQQGDFGMALRAGTPDTQIYNYKYQDVARMTQNGAMLRQQVRNYTVRSGTSDFYPLYGEAFLPYYFPTLPSETNWADNYYFDVTDGWCMSYSLPPNDWDCFTNGVGFILTARPAGNRNEHGTWHDGAPQFWAYGAQVSSGGIGQYYKHPMFYPGLFVDGIGTCTPNGQNPTEEWYSRLIAFTNTANYSYVAGEYAGAYNRSNFSAGGGSGNLTAFYNNSTNRRPYVASVQRHILFPRKKYWVIYDTFTTTTNATFQWKWNVAEPTATVNTSAVSFSYTSTNFLNGSNVTTYVQHIVNSNLMTLTNLVGTNYAAINPFTGEDYHKTTANNGNGPRNNHSIWVYNNTPTTNWHFMTVVYPARWDNPVPPKIVRVDDATVRVTRGLEDDLIGFEVVGTNVMVTVDLNGSSGRPGPPVRLRQN